MRLETVTVLDQQKLGGSYRVLNFISEKIAAEIKPGQFVHLRVAEHNDIVLRRPFSVFKAGKKCLAILYKIVGEGTGIMSQLQPGDKVSMIGPLGNGFPMPAGNVYPVFVAGGYGSAALYLLAERAAVKGILFVGGETAGDILCADEFERLGWQVRIATEDGSTGQKGLVTDILIKYMGIAKLPNLSFRVKRGISATVTNMAEILRKAQDDKRVLVKKRQVALYACGPMGMLKAVGGIAIAGGWKAWLSLDKNMGCGIGACLACVQKIKVAGGWGPDESWKWARICTEGPVFECREIIWD